MGGGGGGGGEHSALAVNRSTHCVEDLQLIIISTWLFTSPFPFSSLGRQNSLI